MTKSSKKIFRNIAATAAAIVPVLALLAIWTGESRFFDTMFVAAFIGIITWMISDLSEDEDENELSSPHDVY